MSLSYKNFCSWERLRNPHELWAVQLSCWICHINSVLSCSVSFRGFFVYMMDCSVWQHLSLQIAELPVAWWLFVTNWDWFQVMLMNGVVYYITAFRQRADTYSQLRPALLIVMMTLTFKLQKRWALEYLQGVSQASKIWVYPSQGYSIMFSSWWYCHCLWYSGWWMSIATNSLFIWGFIASPSISSFHGPEELVSELKSVQSELVSKVENLDHSVQSIVEALPLLAILEMEVTVIPW